MAELKPEFVREIIRVLKDNPDLHREFLDAFGYEVVEVDKSIPTPKVMYKGTWHDIVYIVRKDETE